jgi:hypothetical protein
LNYSRLRTIAGVGSIRRGTALLVPESTVDLQLESDPPVDLVAEAKIDQSGGLGAGRSPD